MINMFFQCHNTIGGFTHQSRPVHSAERWPTFSGLSLPRTTASVKIENMGGWLQLFNKIKLTSGLNLIHVSSLLVSEVFSHFDNVRCHGFQRDESRLHHVNLLFISNDPGKILWIEHRTCDHCQLWKTHTVLNLFREFLLLTVLNVTFITWTFSMLRVAASLVWTSTENEHPVTKDVINKCKWLK